ncbi:MAG TPA: hypothetical protein VG821_04595, partial [Rhizomicrobium sp.]|jgi:hypothetical protein|nr:hypothetical protein [Rhizomicrobium sp.]
MDQQKLMKTARVLLAGILLSLPVFVQIGQQMGVGPRPAIRLLQEFAVCASEAESHAHCVSNQEI